MKGLSNSKWLVTLLVVLVVGGLLFLGGCEPAPEEPVEEPEEVEEPNDEVNDEPNDLDDELDENDDEGY